MKHVNLAVQGDREVPRQGRSEQGEDQYNVPEASKNRCKCPAGASRWRGHQEEAATANIENKKAEVGSISSDMASERRQPVQMARSLQKETDTQDMNVVVGSLTTGIDAAGFQAQQTAQQQFHNIR